MRPIQPWRRRNTLGAVGLVVAAIIAVVLPLAYATFEYRERSDVLAFKAQLSAAKVAKYIYGRKTCGSTSRCASTRCWSFPLAPAHFASA